MQERYKYQYSYHILPYRYEGKYEKYLTKLLLNENIYEHRYEKVKDLEIYSHFKKDILDLFFYKWPYEKNEEISIEKKAKMLSKKEAVVLDYDYHTIANKGIREEKNDSISYDLFDFKIIVFRTGIAMIVLKTVLMETDRVSDVLDFNYQMRSMVSKSLFVKKLDNIKIHLKNNSQEGQTDLKNVIEEFVNLENIEDLGSLWTDSFYTFSYLCVDNMYWNESTKEKDLFKTFYKYVRVNQSSYDTEAIFDTNNITKVMEELRYSKLGVSKVSSSLMCSGTDIFNFTILLRDYETKYLYTYILALYQRQLIIKISKLFNSSDKRKNKKAAKEFERYMKKLWHREITLSEKGSIYYNNLKEVFDLQNLYGEAYAKYRLMERMQNKKNGSSYVLTISLILLIINALLIIFRFKM